jgi:hypothetical protein
MAKLGFAYDKTWFCLFSSLTQLVTGNGLSPFLGRFDPCSEYLSSWTLLV